MAGQLGIWYAQQLSPDNPVYNLGQYLEIHGDLDIGLFAAALRRTIGEVEAVRLRFSRDEEGLWQRVGGPDGGPPVHVLDVTDAADPRAAAEEWMWADMLRPADLREGPLFTHALFRAGQGRYFWYQRGHHIAIDGFSGSIVAARLAEVYASLLTGLVPSEGRLDPFSVLADADSSYRASADFASDRAFWLDVLSDFPEVATVNGRQAPRVLLPPMRKRHTEDISVAAAADLRKAAQRLGISFSELIITAAAIYLHRMTGARDIVLGLSVLGRGAGRSRMVPGMTANVVPVRLSVGRGESLAGLVRQASGVVREALRHQRYRYEDIRRDLGLADGSPLFGLLVNIMSFDYRIRFGDCSITLNDLANGPIQDAAIAVYDPRPGGTMPVAFDTNPDF